MLELKGLVEAAGGQVVATIAQMNAQPNPTTLIGKGKVEEVYQAIAENQADTIVFLQELSGSQIRNLEDYFDRKVLDRTNLILDIFAMRARSHEGKLQVKLAQLNYRLPRLVGYRKYLSRLGGGIGTRGPGEQKLEVDRRHIQREIKNIRSKLKKVKLHRQQTRSQRLKSKQPLVSLVGYTNAGKSTIMNQLLKLSNHQNGKDVLVKDMLFASLDPSVRSIVIDENFEFLVVDTVGFVSDLPTLLVESFNSTLEEIEYSDLIAIVLDASSPQLSHQLETTNAVLEQLKVSETPTLLIYNKSDLVDPLLNLENGRSAIHISAFKDEDIKELIERFRTLLDDENDNIV